MIMDETHQLLRTSKVGSQNLKRLAMFVTLKELLGPFVTLKELIGLM